MMVRRLVFGLAMLGFVGAGTAHAVDYCVDLTGGITLVLKSFKPPKPGKCKAIKGAYFDPSFPAPIVGPACTNTAGSEMRMGISFANDSSSRVGQIELPYPSLTGGFFDFTLSQDSNTVTGLTASPINAAPCPAPVNIP